MLNTIIQWYEGSSNYQVLVPADQSQHLYHDMLVAARSAWHCLCFETWRKYHWVRKHKGRLFKYTGTKLKWSCEGIYWTLSRLENDYLLNKKLAIFRCCSKYSTNTKIGATSRSAKPSCARPFLFIAPAQFKSTTPLPPQTKYRESFIHIIILCTTLTITFITYFKPWALN